jgi:hypothetical protein
MLSRLKLKRGAVPAEPPAPEPAVAAGRAWDILGGSAVRHPDHFTAAPAAPAPPGDSPAPGASAQGASMQGALAPGGAAVGEPAGAEAGPAPTILAMFHATLARDPIPEEVDYYSGMFRQHGSPGWVRASLQVLTDSAEFKLRMRGPVEAAFLGAAEADSPPMRHAVSLGTSCYASWLLKDMGLRRYSAPFDWLFSSPQLVAHCLADDFATLLDRAHHEQYGVQGQALHRFYHRGFATEAAPWGEAPLFFHHNPTTDENHARLVRVVDRFRRLLDSADDALFLMVIGRNRPQADLVGSVEAVAAALEARTRNATLLAVAHTGITDQDGAQSARIWQCGPHSLHALRSSSEMVEGLAFAHYFDNLLIKRLIYRHRFDLKPQP